MVGPGSVDHTCNICLDTLGANGGVSTLLCGHPFCRECLARWQATSQLCPVCRTDQRTLERNNGQPNLVPRADEPEDAEGPSLATILGLLGQLALRSGEPGLSAAHSRSDGQDSNGITFHWSSQPSPGTGSAAPSQTSSAAISELQSSVQFVMARIESLDRRPLYWNAQISELQQASAQLDACRHGSIANPAQVVQQVQQYTDTVNAQLDEFLTQSEAREQQRQQAQVHQHYSGHPAGSSQPSAPPFASSPPSSSTATGSVPNVSSNASSSSGWSWKWGWGPAPAGTLPAEAPASAPATDAQQASGIGAGTAAAAAAALTTVGAAAAAAYRRMTATASSDANTAGSSGSASEAQHQSAAGSSYSSQGQPGRSGVASGRAAGQAAPPPTSSAAAGPPVQGIYEAVRNIFDQHVSSDSSLGRWGEVAHHLNELHGQMSAGDSQSQDASRLLASAVNAYSAYRRATASSANP
ncbi:MAG: zinc C3HC4 type family [Trebouxia sp. A1-2]|nr:MAG: zinc C3HC4 type family [Trebouxia sp. A1-2]